MLDLTRFSRPQLCARIVSTSDALRSLLLQAATDGQPFGPAVPALEAELARYEEALERLDAATAEAA